MPNPLDISPPPNNVEDINHFSWRSWFMSVFTRVGKGPFGVNGYNVSNLPPATDWGSISTTVGEAFSALIFVYDETGGPTLAFSDGTNWRRLYDNTIVS